MRNKNVIARAAHYWSTRPMIPRGKTHAQSNLSNSRWWLLPIAPLVALAAWKVDTAIEAVGYRFGFLIGASLSPISATIAPLVFGLVATILFASIAQVFRARSLMSVAIALVATAYLAYNVDQFIFWARKGTDYGSEVREEYKVKHPEWYATQNR